MQQLVSRLLGEKWGPDEAHGAVCSPAAQTVQAAADLSQAEVAQGWGAFRILQQFKKGVTLLNIHIQV